MVKNLIPLTLISKEQTAKIIKFSDNIEIYKYQLKEMGFVPGSIIKLYATDISGDLRAYIIKNSYFALRKEQSNNILVEIINETNYK
jgi:Fe2+ transport system protein FeoA